MSSRSIRGAVVCALAALLALPAAAETCVIRWSCSGSQCAAVMGGYSGTSPPVSSEAECRSWIGPNSTRAGSYPAGSVCECSGAAGGSSAGGSSSGGTSALQDSAINAFAAIPNLNASQATEAFALGVGALILDDLLNGDPQAAARAAAAQAEANRQAYLAEQERLRQLDLTRDRILAGIKRDDAMSQLADMAGTGGGHPLGLKLGDPVATPVETRVSAAIVAPPPAGTRCAPSQDAGVVDLCVEDTDPPVGPPAERVTDPDAVRVVTGIMALATEHGWSRNELARLDLALNSLQPAEPLAPEEEINPAWEQIEARGVDVVLAGKAALGTGPGIPGAGLQTKYHDCAIFALANAAQVPYGVVGAQATELMRQGNWRDDDERGAPQAAIEKAGLMGGEVIMLAEAFGRVEVVTRTGFAQVLAEGHPVLVAITPKNSMTGRHQVVLTKTFTHEGATWYEMMDSNLGPVKRRYLTETELGKIIVENGIAFRPEPGTTPKLLRASN